MRFIVHADQRGDSGVSRLAAPRQSRGILKAGTKPPAISRNRLASNLAAPHCFRAMRVFRHFLQRAATVVEQASGARKAGDRVAPVFQWLNRLRGPGSAASGNDSVSQRAVIQSKNNATISHAVESN
jgi:hypothetical protein